MFEELTKKNSKEFYRLYLANKEAALADLFADAAQDGISLDFSPDSLTALWQWAYPQFEYCSQHPVSDDIPIWYQPEYVNHPHFSGPPMTLKSIKIRDKLAYYFGEVLIRHIPNLHWELCEEKNSPYSNCPIINGATATYPLRVVGNVLSRAVKKSPHHSEDTLKEAFRMFKNEVETDTGYEP